MCTVYLLLSWLLWVGSNLGQPLSHAVSTLIQFNHVVGAPWELGRTDVHHLQHQNIHNPKSHINLDGIYDYKRPTHVCLQASI